MQSSMLLIKKKTLDEGEQIIVPATHAQPSSLQSIFAGSYAGWVSFILNASYGTMWGTVWGENGCTSDSHISRASQHCFPSAAEFNNTINKGLRVYAKLRQSGTRSSYPGVSRNGYPSSSYGTYTATSHIDEFVYTDINGQLKGMHPTLMTGPTSNVILLG